MKIQGKFQKHVAQCSSFSVAALPEISNPVGKPQGHRTGLALREARRNESTLRSKVKACMLLKKQQQLRVARILPGDAKRRDAPSVRAENLTYQHENK